MKKKIVYQKAEITVVSFLDRVDIITTSGGNAGENLGGGGTVVPPISNGGDYKGDNY